MAFDWAAMTPERFAKLLRLYGEYWETRGKNPDTWGMFSLLKLTHRSAGQIVMLTQFCNPDGTCRDLSVLNDFLARFRACAPVPLKGRPIRSGRSSITAMAISMRSCNASSAVMIRTTSSTTRCPCVREEERP
ncbi:hypothetical protein RSK60_120012 [Ralstonia solanacearum K60]|nr:hypothetical protein RSK60_120012 [Ralstonia solanacearum K60]